MSLLRFEPLSQSSSAELPRRTNQPDSQHAGDAGAYEDFGTTLSAMQKKQAPSASIPTSRPKKLDKKPSSHSQSSSTHSKDPSAEGHTTQTQETKLSTEDDASTDDPGSPQASADKKQTDPTDPTAGAQAAAASSPASATPDPADLEAAANAGKECPPATPAASQLPVDGVPVAADAQGEAKASNDAADENPAAPGAQAKQNPTPPLVKAAHNANSKSRHLAPPPSDDDGPAQDLQSQLPDAQPSQVQAATDAVMDAAIKTAPSVPLEPQNGAAGTEMPLGTQVPASMPQTDTAAAKAAPAAQDSPVHNPQETFDQVVLGLKGKIDARTGKAEIRLDPPNLGTVRVSVTLDNGALTAEFHSASNVVRDLLKGNLDKLKSTLQGQGVAVDRLAVDAPPDAAASGQNSQASFGSATHDGRSAGQYQSNGQGGQQRSGGGGGSGDGFARMFSQAQEAPLDLVA